MYQKYFFKSFIAGIAISLMTLSCSKSDDIETFEPQTYNVGGKVEKGPFISGSTITMQPMNAKMQPSGQMYTTTIQDNTGSFTFGSKLFDAPFAELTANGYFFNEVSGALSSGTLNLRAIVDLSNQSTINVNILTHLKYQRILNLVGQGSNFRQANEQAQKELFTAFGLSQYAETDASLFSIVKGNDESAALIAVSSLLLVDRSEAELTEYLAKLSQEFGKEGIFSPETKEQIKEDKKMIANKLSQVRDNIINRYNDLGVSVEVKELERFFDWDDDGIAGNEILQDGEEVILETTLLEIPNEGGTYQIKITSAVPVYLEPSGEYESKPVDVIGSEQIFQNLYKDYPNQNISIEKSIQDNTLTVKAKTLNSRVEKSTIIFIYDYLGNVLGSVDLVQEGNKEISVPLLGEGGKAVVNAIATELAKGLSLYNLLEQYYYYNRQDNSVNRSIDPSSSIIADSWGTFYTSIRYNLMFKNADSHEMNLYQEICDVFSSMQYYYMVVAWGDVPYITDYNWYQSGAWDIKRTNATEILNDLKNNLMRSIEVLEEKRNESMKDTDSFFFVSKDVARVLLANIYMYQGDYSNAEPLLSKVIQNGYYELDATNYSSIETMNSLFNNGDGKEILFASYYSPPRTRNTIWFQSSLIPIMTYTDVVLSYAECLYKNGKTSGAKTQLNAVVAAKDIEVSNENVLTGIAEARKQLLLYCASNFAFMKRNGMAEEEYGVESYRLLLPIPMHDMNTNPAMTQNPGY